MNTRIQFPSTCILPSGQIPCSRQKSSLRNIWCWSISKLNWTNKGNFKTFVLWQMNKYISLENTVGLWCYCRSFWCDSDYWYKVLKSSYYTSSVYQIRIKNSLVKAESHKTGKQAFINRWCMQGNGNGVTHERQTNNRTMDLSLGEVGVCLCVNE